MTCICKWKWHLWGVRSCDNPRLCCWKMFCFLVLVCSPCHILDLHPFFQNNKAISSITNACKTVLPKCRMCHSYTVTWLGPEMVFILCFEERRGKCFCFTNTTMHPNFIHLHKHQSGVIADSINICFSLWQGHHPEFPHFYYQDQLRQNAKHAIMRPTFPRWGSKISMRLTFIKILAKIFSHQPLETTRRLATSFKQKTTNQPTKKIPNTQKQTHCATFFPVSVYVTFWLYQSQALQEGSMLTFTSILLSCKVHFTVYPSYRNRAKGNSEEKITHILPSFKRHMVAHIAVC